MTGATYTAFFTKQNDAIICKEPKGEKYRKSLDWKVPAVSISWLIDVLFSKKNVADKLDELKYKNFNSEKEPLQISSKLVSNLLTGWKNPIVITRQVYYG